MEEGEMLKKILVFKAYKDLLKLSSTMMNKYPGNEPGAIEFLEEQKKAILDFIENEGSQELKEAIPHWSEFLQDDLQKPAEDFSQAIKRFAMVLAATVAIDPDNAQVFVGNMVAQEKLRSDFGIED
tara:strand:+ start:398 stop:775 length:378 start_codon:yes stop_codon:yes gene_type:complete